MAISNYAWPIATLFFLGTPGHAATKLVMHRIDCTTDQARAPARFEQTARPATAPRHAEAQTCPVSEQSVNGWMMVILIAGAIIIGVPAARSRNRHVVFS